MALAAACDWEAERTFAVQASDWEVVREVGRAFVVVEASAVAEVCIAALASAVAALGAAALAHA